MRCLFQALRIVFLGGFLFTFFSFPSFVHAQVVGQVAGVEGTVEVLHAGASTWDPLAIQDDILLQDRVRTQPQSKLKILFQDDSILTLGAETELTVDEQVLQPSGGDTSLFNLIRGVLKAVVADRYALPGSRFEIRTPTAVAGVRGTGFFINCILGADPSLDNCLFVGLFNRIRVESLTFPGQPVFLERQFYTEVQRNQPPDPPQPLPAGQFEGLVEDTNVIGTGAPEDQLGTSDIATTSGEVPSQDQPTQVLSRQPLGGPGQAGADQPSARDAVTEAAQPTQSAIIGPGTKIDQPLNSFDPSMGGTPPGVIPGGSGGPEPLPEPPGPPLG